MEERAVAIVAVDGGASRCRLAAFDALGVRLGACAVDAHASLTLGEAEAWDNVRLGLARLLAGLDVGSDDAAHGGRGADDDAAAKTGRASGVPPAASSDVGHRILAGSAVLAPDGRWPPRLAFGLAGALREERRARFLELVEAATGGASECRLVTDGHAQLLGASGGAPGVCLAVGTGSVVHWLDRDGAAGMAGGWGFPVGDEGSGAWLGARLLQRYLWHRDGERSESPLMGVVERRVGDSVAALQGRTTDARSSEHARLARDVVEGAERGDALAVSLLDEGADRCVRLLRRAPDDLPFYVVGGLADVYSPRLAARLGRRPDAPHGDVFDGLRAIAFGTAGR